MTSPQLSTYFSKYRLYSEWTCETKQILTIEPMEERFHEGRERQRKQGQSKHQVEVQDSIYKVEMPWLCPFKKKTSTYYK